MPTAKQFASMVVIGLIPGGLTTSQLTAQVITDGSLGPASSLTKSGNTFNVTPDLGRVEGTNLFHSFQQLDLARNETASFSGPDSVTNVLARVTGGAASNIDGTLQCTIPSANFFLMNPSGVVFGPNAKLDVTGSFAVTTADVIRLSGGGAFAASTNPADSVLTTAAPSAFGFLGDAQPASVTFDRTPLRVPEERVLSIVGGDIRLGGSSTVTLIGSNQRPARVNVVSVRSAGDATFDPADPASPVNVASFTELGDVDVARRSRLEAGGGTGGNVVIRAGGLRVSDSIVATNTLALDERGVDIVLTRGADITT